MFEISFKYSGEIIAKLNLMRYYDTVFQLPMFLCFCLVLSHSSQYLQEVVFIAVPYILSVQRASLASYTTPIFFGNVKMVSALGGLEIDPWSFLLPLTPMVWASTLAALLVMVVILNSLPPCLPGKTQGDRDFPTNSFNSIRVMLQQGEASATVIFNPIT